MVSPLEFSNFGDEHFSRLAAKFPDSPRRRLLIEHRLDPERYEQIRLAAAVYVSCCLNSKRALLSEPELIDTLLRRRGTIPNYDIGGLLMPKREFNVEFNQFHKSVAQTFRDFQLEGLLDTIDLPVNLRMVYGATDKERARQPFSSSKPHSDVWAGVPYDAVIVVLPLFGDIEHITIECGEMPREQEMAWMRPLDDYSDGDVRKVVPYSDAPLRHGSVYFADARLLHQTVRRTKEGVRLSVDFRFRMKSDGPYRSLLPESRGVDSMKGPVSYEEWLRVGSDSLITFNDSVAEVSARRQTAAPIYDANYKTVQL